MERMYFEREPLRVPERQVQGPNLEQFLQQSIARYLEIRRSNPGLHPYMGGDPTGPADVLRNLRRLLAQNPQLLLQLEAAEPADPDHLALLVIPDQGLVLSRQEGKVTALAPSIGCTLNAIDDLQLGQIRRIPGQYDIVTSDNGLLETAWQVGRAGQRGYLPYNFDTMRPEDYIALAAQGVITNELFRMPLIGNFYPS